LDPVFNPEDQSYTGLLTFGSFVQRSEGRRFEHAQLDVGYIGQNSGAQALQEFAHSVLPEQGDPTWVAQQASGLAVFGTYQRRWKLRWAQNSRGEFGLLSGSDLDAVYAGSASSGGPGFEIIPYAGGRLGNIYADASFGAIFRIGWPLPSDFGQSRIFDFTDHTRRAADGLSFSLFASAGGRLVARNALIEGNILGGDRRLGPKPFVGEFSGGAQLEYQGWILAYSQSLLTEEFNGQNGVSRFGTFTLTFNLAY
ncbi:MAG: lipid A deacylase LpxR family protein, partial [Planctomycetota bacterium]